MNAHDSLVTPNIQDRSDLITRLNDDIILVRYGTTAEATFFYSSRVMNAVGVEHKAALHAFRSANVESLDKLDELNDKYAKALKRIEELTTKGKGKKRRSLASSTHKD